VARSDAVHLDAVQSGAWRARRPAAAEKPHLVTLRGKTAKDLV